MRQYRIYTEDKGDKIVEKIACDNFDGFTILHGTGYWKGHVEKSIIVEVISEQNILHQVKICAQEIKRVNKQESVLVTETKVRETYIQFIPPVGWAGKDMIKNRVRIGEKHGFYNYRQN